MFLFERFQIAIADQFSLENSDLFFHPNFRLYYLGAHAKIWNPTITPSVVLNSGGKKKRRKEEEEKNT